MNILDENILESQRQLLRGWRIPVRQIGSDIGRKGMSDEDVLRVISQLPHATFLTGDLRFYGASRCNRRYGLVLLAVRQNEVAHFVRRFLRHPAFNSRAKRVGAVVRVSHGGLSVWRLHEAAEIRLPWRL